MTKEVNNDGDWIGISLPFRAPIAAVSLWGWLSAHAIAGVEEVEGRTYRRSLDLPGGPAVVELDCLQPHDSAVDARFLLSRPDDLAEAVRVCRHLLDLDADPVVIEGALRSSVDKQLSGTHLFLSMMNRRPGIRTPGDVAGIDALVKAVVHQQVSVASARGSCVRLVAAHGARLDGTRLVATAGTTGTGTAGTGTAVGPVGTVTHLFPRAEVWASLEPGGLGLPLSRATALVAAAKAVVSGEVDVAMTADLLQTKEALCAIKGIGPWTATIVALRALGGSDEFSSGDLALRRAAASIGLTDHPAELQKLSERWSPWRSYVMHHLWAEYANPGEPDPSQLARSDQPHET